MKANKCLLAVRVETLCPRSMPGMLRQLADEISDEFQNGELVASDGDSIKWDMKREEVTF